MKEITYSQDLIIKDRNTLAALCIFCDKIWLPYKNVANDLHFAASEAYNRKMKEDLDKRLNDDTEKEFFVDWRKEHSLLFSENILKYLPVMIPKEHKHRNLNSSFEDLYKTYPNIRSRGITAQLALNHHFHRDDLPGFEFFEGADHKGEIEIAKTILFIDVPKFSVNDKEICKLRFIAHKKGIKEFWEMIDEQQKYAAANVENYIQRAEKIRTEFKKWRDEENAFRIKTLALPGLISLCFVNSIFLAPAAIATYTWLGDLNKAWVRRKDSEHKAFKFISRVHEKIHKSAGKG